MAHFVYSRPFLCLRLSDSTPTVKMVAAIVTYIALSILTLGGWWLYLTFSKDPGEETRKNTEEVQTRVYDKLHHDDYLPTHHELVPQWKRQTLMYDVQAAFPLQKSPNNPGGLDGMTIDVLKSDEVFLSRLKNCARFLMICWKWNLSEGKPYQNDLSSANKAWETYGSPEAILHMLESLKLFLGEDDPIYKNFHQFAVSHIPFLAQKERSAEQSQYLQCWQNSTTSWTELPFEYSSTLAFPTQSNLDDKTIAQLKKEQQFIFDLEIAGQCILHSWGWDLQKSQKLPENSDHPWAQPDREILIQIMDSFKLFLGEEDPLYHSLCVFAFNSNLLLEEQTQTTPSSNFFNAAAEFFGFSETVASSPAGLLLSEDIETHVNESHINHIKDETAALSDIYQSLDPLQHSDAQEQWNQVTRNEWINRAFPVKAAHWEINKLKEDETFIDNLKKSAIALMSAWGWDLEKGKPMTNAWMADSNPDALVRMLTCLKLFLPKDDPILSNLELFALDHFAAFVDAAPSTHVEKAFRAETAPRNAYEFLQKEHSRLKMMFYDVREASLMAGIYAEPNPGTFVAVSAEMIQIMHDSGDIITANPSLCYLAFPIHDPSVSIDDQPSNLTEEEVALLKQQPEFIANLKESAYILMKNWGWDLETGQPIGEGLSSWEETGNLEVLIRMGKSLQLLIPGDSYYTNLVAFASQNEISCLIEESSDRMSLGLSATMEDLVDESVELSSHSSIAQDLGDRVEMASEWINNSEENIPETALGNLARDIRLHIGLGSLYHSFTDTVAKASNHITQPWVREALGLDLSDSDIDELRNNHEFCQNLELEARVLMKSLDEQIDSFEIDAVVDDEEDKSYQDSKEMALDAQHKNLIRFANNLLLITQDQKLYQEFMTKVNQIIQASA